MVLEFGGSSRGGEAIEQCSAHQHDRRGAGADEIGEVIPGSSPRLNGFNGGTRVVLFRSLIAAEAGDGAEGRKSSSRAGAL